MDYLSNLNTYDELYNSRSPELRIEVENTREGWYGMSLNGGGIDKDVGFLFITDLGSDHAAMQNDTLHLQYLFIRLEALNRAGKLSFAKTHTLVVKVHSANDKFRVFTYLSFTRFFLPFLEIFLVDMSVKRPLCERAVPQGEFLRVVPVLRITGDLSKNGVPFQQLACQNYGVTEERFKEAFCAAIDNTKELNRRQGISFKAISATSPNTVLPSIAETLLWQLIKDIRGTSEFRFDKKIKRHLLEMLRDFLEQRMVEAQPIVQIVWLYSLCVMSDKKTLFDAKKGDDEVKLSITLLEKSYANVRSFCDGLLQVLENSCQHTEAGVAYLSMRMHHIDRLARDSDLESAVSSYLRLKERYFKPESVFDDSTLAKREKTLLDSQVLLTKDAPYYLELNITDDASLITKTGERDGKPASCGISEKYAANNNEVASDITLKQVFSHYPIPSDACLRTDRDKAIDFISHHYGIHLLKKVVFINRGLCQVFSPKNMSADDQENCAEVLFFPVKDEGKEFEYAAIKKPLHGSEYRILLPLGGAEEYTRQSLCDQVLSHDIWDTGVLTQSTLIPPNKEIDMSLFYNQPVGQEAKPLCEITYMPQHEKRAQCVRAEEWLREQLGIKHFEWNESAPVCLLRFGELSELSLELIAKGLFRYIASVHYTAVDMKLPKVMRIALHFSHNEQVNEFLRLYSIFYNEAGQNFYMEGVQLALCKYNPEVGASAVELVLAGTSIDSAYRTTEMSAYYQSGASFQSLAVIDYLTRYGIPNNVPAEPVRLFPFDLYLSLRVEEDSEQDGRDKKCEFKISPEFDCWFMHHMAHAVTSDLQEAGFGCKIPGIHVRLGSKMHITDFFQAELLFQNVGCISRFAFLIARRFKMIHSSQSKTVLLVGYEDYSSLLVQYVQMYLECALGEGNVKYAMFSYSTPERVTFSPGFTRLKNKVTFLKGAELVCILPVGTTLSTINQMRNAVAEALKMQNLLAEPFTLKNTFNIAAVVVADATDSKDGVGAESELQRRYWSYTASPYPEKGEIRGGDIITLSPQGSKDRPPQVRYFIQVYTRWHDHLDDARNGSGDKDVLVYVDSTSTVPNMIFPLHIMDSNGVAGLVAKNDEKENDRRLKLLRGCIHYGHIVDKGNHLLYDVDFAKYFECANAKGDGKESKKKDETKSKSEDLTVDEWLERLGAASEGFLDSGAYNIVISPLDMENAPFLFEAATKLFAHSIRFLRIPIMQSRRDDVRSKFSFISMQCKKIMSENPSAKINVYFVDNSIITGETLRRGRMFAQILLRAAEIERPTESVFRGVLCLVNRSSFDTVHTFVQNPKQDFRAYVHMAVPHYNTHQNRCPGCNFAERNFELMHSCSTNSLAREFGRLSVKHKLRTRKEHEEYQSDALFSTNAGFRQFAQWIYNAYYHNDSEDPAINNAYSLMVRLSAQATLKLLDPAPDIFFKEGETIEIDRGKLHAPLIEYLSKVPGNREAYLETMSRITLNNFVEPNQGDFDLLRKLWVERVLADKAMLRMVCTHEAYMAMEPSGNSPRTHEQIGDTLLGLFKKINEQHKSIHRYDCVISCFKVLSREYLAKYHNIRQEIATALIECLHLLLGNAAGASYRQLFDAKLPSPGKGNPSKPYPLVYYQLLVVIYRQLADLQMSLISKQSIITSLEKKTNDLLDNYFGGLGKPENLDEFLLLPLPPQIDRANEIAKSLKWLSMSNDERNSSFAIQQLPWQTL